MTDGTTSLTTNIKAAGCAAKISASQLHEIVSGLSSFSVPQLLTSIASFEDAAVYKISDELALVNTIDFFPPPLDDARLFGRIAAANALSDIYAMGGRPLLALSVLSFPTCDLPLSLAREIVEGAAETVKQAGAVLAGGHSIAGQEPLFGLSVLGSIDPQKILTNAGGKDGDALVLCKAIGTGVGLLALKGGVLSQNACDVLLKSLTQLNDLALKCAQSFSLHAATDVTGYGVIGHLHEMAKGAGLKAVLRADAVPVLPEAISFAEQGLVPAGAYANRESYKQVAYIKDGIDLALADLLFDPQTSGGLLFALDSREADKLCKELKAQGCVGEIIGHLCQGTAGIVEVV